MTTQDKEAVELEKAAITHAGYVFQQVRGFVPDEFTWKDAQFGKELGAYGAAFLLGVEWQKNRKQVNRFVMGNPEYIKEATKKLSETIE